MCLLGLTLAVASQSATKQYLSRGRRLHVHEEVPCPPLDCSKIPPAQHVKDLTPCDVEAVFAFGDSITAAAVAEPLYDGVWEFRGLTWSMGGDDGYITLPNIIRHVGSHRRPLIGPSLSYHFIEMRNEPHDYPEDMANAAQSGAKAEDLIKNSGNQSAYLDNWASKHGVTDDMWKVVTIFIGPNDVCGACNGSRGTRPEDFANDIDQTLVYLRNRFKRVFVNVVTMFNISSVYTVSDPYFYCRTFHEIAVECKCLWHDGDQGRRQMDDATAALVKVVNQVVAKWATKNFPDFAVVEQPYMEGFTVPNIEWLSPVDCFHPSVMAHKFMASGLWNSMFLPVGRKDHNMNWQEQMYCPNTSVTYKFQS